MTDRAGRTAAYLDNACMGRPSAAAMAEVRALMSRIEVASEPPTDVVVELQRSYGRAREALSRLLGVPTDELALVESTTHGLGLVAAALPLEPGENVLVCDLEFFPPVLCWRTRCGCGDVEIRAVPNRAGRVGPDDFAAHMDGATRALVVSSVQEINGFRVDMAGLAELAHDHGALLIVDGVQEVGALRVDLSAPGVDVYCAGGHKWLRNPFGMGFLFAREALARTLEPPFYGYFGAGEPPGGWDLYLSSPARSCFDPLDFDRSMNRFETGGYGNYAGATTLAATLEELLALGIDVVEARILALGGRLVAGADAMTGVEVRSAREPPHRSGIVCMGLSGGPGEERAFVAWLQPQGIFVSVRYAAGTGGIRVSPHHYTTEDDIDRLLAATADWVAGRR